METTSSDREWRYSDAPLSVAVIVRQGEAGSARVKLGTSASVKLSSTSAVGYLQRILGVGDPTETLVGENLGPPVILSKELILCPRKGGIVIAQRFPSEERRLTHTVYASAGKVCVIAPRWWTITYLFTPQGVKATACGMFVETHEDPAILGTMIQPWPWGNVFSDRGLGNICWGRNNPAPVTEAPWGVDQMFFRYPFNRDITWATNAEAVWTSEKPVLGSHPSPEWKVQGLLRALGGRSPVTATPPTAPGGATT